MALSRRWQNFVLCSEMSSFWRQHFLKGKKALRTRSCKACKRTPSLKAKQTRTPHKLCGRRDQPFFLQPYKFQLICWWLLTSASWKTETSFTRKTLDNTLRTGGVKSSQVFLLPLRPFPWHHMLSKKEKTLQANASQPSLLFVWFKTDLN